MIVAAGIGALLAFTTWWLAIIGACTGTRFVTRSDHVLLLEQRRCRRVSGLRADRSYKCGPSGPHGPRCCTQRRQPGALPPSAAHLHPAGPCTTRIRSAPCVIHASTRNQGIALRLAARSHQERAAFRFAHHPPRAHFLCPVAPECLASAAAPQNARQVANRCSDITCNEKRPQIQDLRALSCIWRSERDSNPR